MTEPEYEDSKEVARLNRAFYQAFERLDLEAMQSIWLDDPAIKCIHPGGETLAGRERVLGSWKMIFEHTTRIRVEIEDLSIAMLGEHAWASNVERVRAPTENGIQVTEMAATNLFRRIDGRWWMMLHHASPIARRFFPF